MKTLRHYTWWIPFLYGLLLFSAGLYLVIAGKIYDTTTYERIAIKAGEAINKQEPVYIQYLVRFTGGNATLVLGLVIGFIAATGYRRKQVDAWIIIWVLPLHAAVDLLLLILSGGISATSITWDVLLISFTVASQLITYPELNKKQ